MFLHPCACRGQPPVKLTDPPRCLNCGLPADPAGRRAYRWAEGVRADCPDCGEPLQFHRDGVEPQGLCEACGVAAEMEPPPSISW